MHNIVLLFVNPILVNIVRVWYNNYMKRLDFSQIVA